MTDPERRIRQLPGELLVAALPEDTADDARIKKVFTNQCTGCHSPGYRAAVPLRRSRLEQDHQPDEDGAEHRRACRPNAKANDIIEHNQKQLAAYLARARGPGETSMKFTHAPAADRRSRPRGLDAL